MRLRDLRDRHGKLVAEMRAIVDKPEGDGGDLSAQQQQRFDELKSEATNLEKQMERRAFLDDMERRAEGEPLNGTGDDRLDTAMQDFSLRAVIAHRAGLAVDAGRELELCSELQQRSGRKPNGIFVPMSVFNKKVEQRVVTTAAPGGGPGGNIIATDHLGGQFIDRLRAAIRVRQLGARVLTGLVGNVDIPRLKASATVGWVAENAALTPSDSQYDKVSLAPKHAGGIVEFSRNMLMQSSPDIEQLIRDDFAKVLAEAVDSVSIQGGGSNEPDGILETTGIGDVAIGTDGGAITWDKVIDLIAEVEIDNSEGTAFLTNSKVVKSARKTAKVSSTDSVMVMESPRELAGYPLASTNLVPSDLDKGSSTGVCSALIFGNWMDLLIGIWSELDILVNPYESTAFSKGNVQVRGMMTVDLGVRHAESFAAIQDLTTA